MSSGPMMTSGPITLEEPPTDDPHGRELEALRLYFTAGPRVTLTGVDPVPYRVDHVRDASTIVLERELLDGRGAWVYAAPERVSLWTERHARAYVRNLHRDAERHAEHASTLGLHALACAARFI